jgi:hypothetical protein
MVFTRLGYHFCPGCWRDSTSTGVASQPATPMLDRLLAQADELEEA